MWVYAWSGFCMGTAEDPLRFFATMFVKDQNFEKIVGGIFPDFFWLKNGYCDWEWNQQHEFKW